MINKPQDIKWKKDGKNYKTNVDTLHDFLYIMYLIYDVCEKEKREFLIDMKFK